MRPTVKSNEAAARKAAKLREQVGALEEVLRERKEMLTEAETECRATCVHEFVKEQSNDPHGSAFDRQCKHCRVFAFNLK